MTRPCRIAGIAYPSVIYAVKALGATRNQIAGRLYRRVPGYEWLEKPKPKPKRDKPVTLNGITYSSRREAARLLGTTRAEIRHRIWKERKAKEPKPPKEPKLKLPTPARLAAIRAAVRAAAPVEDPAERAVADQILAGTYRHKDARPKFKTEPARLRCLKCQKDFDSEDRRTNRICSDCRAVNNRQTEDLPLTERDPR